MKKIAMILAAGVFSTIANAGPFGLSMGLPAAEIKKMGAEEIANSNLLRTKKVPQPNTFFDEYTLLTSPSHGLCKIFADTPIRDDNAFGTVVKETFASVREALESRYGKTTKNVDGVRAGTIWTGPNDWAMGLHKKERFYASYWFDVKDPEIEAISLKAEMMSGMRSFVTVTYELRNMDACVVEIKSMRNSSL